MGFGHPCYPRSILGLHLNGSWQFFNGDSNMVNSLIGPSRVHKVAELVYCRFDYVKENMAGRRMLRDVLEVEQGDADALKVRGSVHVA